MGCTDHMVTDHITTRCMQINKKYRKQINIESRLIKNDIIIKLCINVSATKLYK